MSTPNMTLVLPVDHGSADVWDVVLDAVFNLVDAHDHSTGKGVKVPSAGLNINADLTFGGFAAIAAKGLGFTEQAAASVTSYADLLFVQSTDHNLYFRNASGTNVQITSGNTLNVSIVGGIGGDYSSVSALLSFDDATKRYLLQSEGSPRPWSGLATADIDLYQKAASIVNKVTLKSPAALAASYSVTMPTALPASTKAIVSSSAGQLQYKDAVVQTLTIPSSAARPTNMEGATTVLFNIVGWQQGSSNVDGVVYPVGLNVGDTITGFSLICNKASDATNTIHAKLWKTIAGANTQINDQSSNANAPGAIPLQATGLSTTIGATEQYYIIFNHTAVTPSATDSSYECYVTYTRAV